jgi:hypothetical protein
MKFKKKILATLVATALSASVAQAAVTDGAFSVNQIFDVQYWWNGSTLNASNFIAPYDSNFNTVTTTSGQYFKFIDNGNGSYGLGLYNADNTLARTIHSTGTITALGSGAIFYIGSGFFGNVITTAQGYSYGQSASFTNMDTSVSSSDLTSYTYTTTTPLAAGQTASSVSTPPPAPSGPVYVAVTQPTVVSVTPTSTNSPPGETAEYAIDGNPSTKYLNFDRANAGFTIKLQSAQVLQGIKFTTANDFEARDPSKYSLFGSNDGVNWTTIVNAESITLSSSRYTQSSMYTINNTNPYFYYFITFPDIKASAQYSDIVACGLACDSVQIGDVEFIYDSTFVFTAPTDTGTGVIANPGTAGSVSSLPVPVVGPQPVVNGSGSTGTNANGTTVTTVDNAGTYTNDGTAGAVTNSGTFTNNGTTDAVTNSGTFTNNGTTAGVTNNQGATFTNNGTTGDVTNQGTFTNNAAGTTGNVINAGTFSNYGDTGTLNNMGVFTNQAGGTVTEMIYNNHVVRNYGTINSITYQGGSFTNYAGGTVGTINTTQAHGNWSNQGTVTGTVTTNGNFNNTATGVVRGLYTNSGTLRNYGTLGAVTNTGTLTTYAGSTAGSVTSSGTFTNGGTAGAVTLTGGSFANTGTVASVDNAAGLSLTNNGTITGTLSNTGTVASLTNNGTIGSVTGTVTNVTNTGTMTNGGTVDTATNSGWFTNALNAVVGFFTNSGTAVNNGTVGDVTNTGTFTNNGTATSVTNSGTFNYNGGTLSSYTQTAGTTVISLNQPILVTGAANLAGGLTVTDVAGAYGKYTVLSAGSVNGTYDPLSGSNYLKYSLTDVKLYVTPDTAATQSSIDATAKNLSNAINLQSNTVTSALGNDCAVFGSAGACVSVNAGMSKAASGDLYNGGLTVAKKVNDNWRVGVTTNAPFSNPTIGNISQSSDPAVGVFATWTKEQLSIQGSAAFNQGSFTVNRNGPENGTGKMSVDNKAYQLRASYAIPVNETTTVTPYAGIRYVESNYSGYTEQGPVFPLTVNSTTRNQTSAIAGVSLAKQLTEKLTGNVSVGVVQNLSGQSATFTGTSEIGGLSTFNSSLPSNGSSNPSVGVGLNYSIDKTTKVGVNAGWQAKGSNADISSVGISLTKGF